MSIETRGVPPPEGHSIQRSAPRSSTSAMSPAITRSPTATRVTRRRYAAARSSAPVRYDLPRQCCSAAKSCGHVLRGLLERAASADVLRHRRRRVVREGEGARRRGGRRMVELEQQALAGAYLRARLGVDRHPVEHAGLVTRADDRTRAAGLRRGRARNHAGADRCTRVAGIEHGEPQLGIPAGRRRGRRGDGRTHDQHGEQQRSPNASDDPVSLSRSPRAGSASCQGAVRRRVRPRRRTASALGREDSNLRSRDQNPLPYRLATPQRRGQG